MRESIISQKYCKRNYIISRPSLEFRGGIRPDDPFFEVLLNIKDIRGDPLPNFQIQFTDRSIPEESEVCTCIIRKYSDIPYRAFNFAKVLSSLLPLPPLSANRRQACSNKPITCILHLMIIVRLSTIREKFCSIIDIPIQLLSLFLILVFLDVFFFC